MCTPTLHSSLQLPKLWGLWDLQQFRENVRPYCFCGCSCVRIYQQVNKLTHTRSRIECHTFLLQVVFTNNSPLLSSFAICSLHKVSVYICNLDLTSSSTPPNPRSAYSQQGVPVDTSTNRSHPVQN